MSEEKIIYRYDDNISFRQCDLANKSNSLYPGDCTNFYTREENWKEHFYCNQYGIHLHCTKHIEIELEHINDFGEHFLRCPKCDNNIKIENLDRTIQNCLKVLNVPKFKDAKLIRLDDWYIPEVREKRKTDSNYWIGTEVKTDRDKDTIIVLYVGKQDSKEKVQYFIKPEKLQLTNDHKDLDPATIISKIEVTLKDRTLIQKYDSK